MINERKKIKQQLLMLKQYKHLNPATHSIIKSIELLIYVDEGFSLTTFHHRGWKTFLRSWGGPVAQFCPHWGRKSFGGDMD